jgi:hypothetical protein
VRAPAEGGTGAPENQAATWRAPAGVSRSTRTGDPPVSTVSFASSLVPGSGVSRIPAGASPRSPALASRAAPAARPSARFARIAATSVPGYP